MIRLRKGPEPAVLTANADEWTQEFLDARARGVTSGVALRRYAHDQVKDALTEETRNKCAYCEAFIAHVSAAHIEHIAPKARCPGKVCVWGNLTIACPECNRRKGDYCDEKLSLVNPYEDDPADHFQFMSAYMYARLGDDRARVTESRVGLSRGALVEARARRLIGVRAMVDAAAASDGALRDVLMEQAMAQAAEDQEFSACVRAFLEVYVEDGNTVS